MADLSLLENARRELGARRRGVREEETIPVGFARVARGRRRLLIVDEPEQHLHPRAQRDIARWLATGAESRETLLATHALAFLDLPDESTTYGLVTRDRDGHTRLTDITLEPFPALERFWREAGLTGRAEALQTVRLVALVEGSHDERVLRHFYGSELDRNRVLVVPVRGAKNVNAIVDAPWLSRLGLPFVILFDEIRASKLDDASPPSGSDVAARAVWEMLHHWDDPRPKPYVASFPLADIFRALPERCVGKAVEAHGGNFPGWDAIDTAFAQQSRVGFKPFLLRQSGLDATTDLNALLEAALNVCRTRPDEALEAAVQTVLDHARVFATSTTP